jgi:outer membrane protein OmpA-like peptidoglycan-associated protein
VYSAIIALTLTGFMSSADIGTTAVPVLRIGVGPRASAMGETFGAMSDDITALYWNPAGLGQLKNTEFFVSHQEWFQDFRDEYASMALPLGRGKLGLGLTYSGTGGVESWGPDNQPGPQALGDYTGIVTGGYGLPVAPNYYFGGNLKLVYDYLGTADAAGTGGAIDIGGLATPWPFLSLGVSLQNLGAASYSSVLWGLPSSARLGAAYHYGDLNVLADLVLPIDNNPELHLGAEYTILNVVSVRAGYKTGPQDRTLYPDANALLDGLCAGLGVRLGRFAIDYAFVPYGTIGSGHRIGVRTFIPPRGFGRVQIRIVDGQTKEPLAADLVITGLLESKQVAPRDGKVNLQKLPEGWIKVTASYPGYYPSTDSIYTFLDREIVLTIPLGRPGRGTIWGQVFDAVTKQHVPAIIESRGKAADEARVDESNTSYTFKNLSQGLYILRAYTTADYFPQTCTVQVEPDRVTNKDFFLLRKRQKIVLKGVNFETGKADIRPEDTSNLDEAGKILQDNPTVMVELAGHTDPREIKTPEYPSNWELSKGRAEAVRKYLIEKYKIKPDRLVARGYADTQPLVPNDSEENMAKNRRTEFVVLEQ